MSHLNNKCSAVTQMSAEGNIQRELKNQLSSIFSFLGDETQLTFTTTQESPGFFSGLLGVLLGSSLLGLERLIGFVLDRCLATFNGLYESCPLPSFTGLLCRITMGVVLFLLVSFAIHSLMISRSVGCWLKTFCAHLFDAFSKTINLCRLESSLSKAMILVEIRDSSRTWRISDFSKYQCEPFRILCISDSSCNQLTPCSSGPIFTGLFNKKKLQ